jgi:metal-responsive CopG/Arc/MetJ family transcriptional regulator
MAKDTSMTRYSMFLTEPLLCALRSKAEQTGTTVSEHIRAALIEYLGFNEKRAHGQSNRKDTR